MLKCEKCGKEVKNDLALRIHNGRMHAEGKKAKTAPKKRGRPAKGDLVCKTCGRSFKMAAHLARHLSVGHTRGRKPQKARKARRVGRPAGRTVALRAAPAGLDVRSLPIDDLLTLKKQVDKRLSGIVRRLQAAKIKV